MQIPIGVSACLLGEQVRFDGGHKRFPFAVEGLAPYVRFFPICPEMAIGLPSPRPALRLVREGELIFLRGSSQPDLDMTLAMREFSQRQAANLSHLCGYLLCAKSPSCGMERVKVYDLQQNQAKKSGVGLYAEAIMQQMPWLPVEEEGRLNDPALRENYVTRIFSLHDFNQMVAGGVSRGRLIAFHSRYKLLLLAHSQKGYRELGRFVADIDQWHSLSEFLAEYKLRFMAVLKHKATRKNHTNVLNHIQGYFSKKLNPAQKQELTILIDRYRQGFQPLQAPITLLRHYLAEHPDDYLVQQRYFSPFPEELRLGYGN